MNEEKRDSESRRRLVQWQNRIRSSRFVSPLVQPHRKLLMDGVLKMTKIVKKHTAVIEVATSGWDEEDDGLDRTITASGAHHGQGGGRGKMSVASFEYLVPEYMNEHLVAVLCSDLMMLCRRDEAQVHAGNMVDDGASGVELYAVPRMLNVGQPASIIDGTSESIWSFSYRGVRNLTDLNLFPGPKALRVADDKFIMYFEVPTPELAVSWVQGEFRFSCFQHLA